VRPPRFLDPKSDVVFKRIFGEHPDLVKSFLNAIMPLPEKGLIEEVEYLPAEQVPRIPVMKNTIVDVKCKDQSGRLFIIEMQMQWSESFTNRLVFGASKAYVQQLKAGEDYQSLCPVYGLGLMNDSFDKDSKDWFHHYRHVNVSNPRKVLKGLELVFIELPKFQPQTWTEKKLGVLWLRFLKEFKPVPQEEVPEEFLHDPHLAKAVELTQESSYTEAELLSYDHYLDAVRVVKTVEVDAFLRGKGEGKAEGIQEGLEKGLQTGLETVAKRMLAQGQRIEDIADITGLSLEHLQTLKA